MAVTSGQVHATVALAALPAIAFAVASLWNAVECRKTSARPTMPSPRGAVMYAEHFTTPTSPEGERSQSHAAQAAFIGHWNYAFVLMGPILDRKARLVDKAATHLIWCIAAFTLPLLVAIGLKLFPLSTAAQDVIPLAK